MKNKIRIGYIGLGFRGRDLLKKCFSEMKDVEIVALCDWDEAKMQEYRTYLVEKGREKPYTTNDYKVLMADENIDAIVIMTGWDTHVELAKASMRAGKYTALEVGCAYDIHE